MKRLLFALCFVLVGCDVPDEGERSLVQQIQDKAIEVCSFRPDSGVVKAMLDATDPTIVGIDIAYAICDVLATKPFGLIYSPDACPKVNGVCVDGVFVPKDEESKEEGEKK